MFKATERQAYEQSSATRIDGTRVALLSADGTTRRGESD